jgi:hypothetical protein
VQLEPISNGAKTGRGAKTWFPPGNNANPKGRPKGSRNKLSEDFVAELYADFQEHGGEAIARCREEKPDVYVRVIAGLMPQKIEVSRTETMSQEEIDRAILRATSLLQEATELRASGIAGSEAQEAQPNETQPIPAV